MTADFLWQMEDVLSLYEQPYDPLNPQVTFDERPCQLIDDVLAPLPMKEGQPKREDYHYQRKGVCVWINLPQQLASFGDLADKWIKTHQRPKSNSAGNC